MLGGIVAQLIFIILMAMSFYACYKVNWYHHICPYVKWLNVMLVAVTIYGVIPIVNGSSFHMGAYANNSIRNYAYLQNMFISIMPIYAFYYYSLRRQLTQRNITYVFLVYFIFSIISYFQLFYNETISGDKENVVNNISYFFVPLIPMLSLVKLNNIWKYTLALIIFGFIMMSMKRGAILTGSVLLLLFVRHHFKMRTKTKLVSAFMLLLTAFFLVYRFLVNLYMTNVFFQRRLALTMEGYSSHRNELFSFFWHYFIEKTSVLEFLFGHGANGTVAIYGQYAHNDWLEFAINQGLLGIIMYIIYWSVFVWEWICYQGNRNCRFIMGNVIVAYFLISLFSGSFACMPLAATLCIGFCLANNNPNYRLKSLS